MQIPTFTTHAEKLHFVTNFLNAFAQDFQTKSALLLYGIGGNGKSKIIEEVAATSPVNILAINTYDTKRFFPATTPTDKCVILLTSNVLDAKTFDLAEALSASIVEFKSDPAFVRSY